MQFFYMRMKQVLKNYYHLKVLITKGLMNHKEAVNKEKFKDMVLLQKLDNLNKYWH